MHSRLRMSHTVTHEPVACEPATHTHARKHVHACMLVRWHTRTRTHMHARERTRDRTLAHVPANASMRTHARKRTQHVHVHARMRAYTHSYYTCTFSPTPCMSLNEAFEVGLFQVGSHHPIVSVQQHADKFGIRVVIEKRFQQLMV